MEKAQALGAASQNGCSRVVRCLQPKLLWLCEGLSDPSTRRFPPCGCVRAGACLRVCVRESSSEAMRSLSEAMRSLSDGFSSFCEKPGYLCLRNASKTRQNGLQAIFWALGRLPYVLAQKTAQNGSNRVLAGFMGSEGF